MFEIKNNEKNKSAVILNPERSEWVSRFHVTSVESVVNDGAKTQCYSAKRDLYGPSLRSTLKMTALALLLSLNLSTALAACGTKAWGDGSVGENESGNKCGVCGAYGHESDCLWEIKDGVLNITSANDKSNVATRNYSSTYTGGTYPYKISSSAPWAGQNITSVNIGDNIVSIGKNAFAGESMITSITGMKDLQTIEEQAFNSATGLTNITIPTGVTNIGDHAFNGSGLTDITIPNSVTSIGAGAFENASSLTSITIPEGVTSIGGSAFNGASSLTSITLPNSVTSIGERTFKNATGLTSVTLSEGITNIGNYAFEGASSLTSITIPDSVTSIGNGAFTYANITNIICKGDKISCIPMVNALPSNLRNKVSYPTDKTSCEGASTSLYVWDSENRKCGRRNEEQCNSVAKYYYNSSAGKCKVLPKTQATCSGTNIEWNATDNKCVNKNYTPSQEANNSNTGGDDTGGDDIGDISGDFNPTDCYNNGQVPYDNKCWDEYPFARKRWTPAEAAEWLHDGNDNFVVITFKK